MSDFITLGRLRVRPEAVAGYWDAADHLNPHMPSTAVVIQGVADPVFVDMPFAQVDERLNIPSVWDRPENNITDQRMRGEIA